MCRSDLLKSKIFLTSKYRALFIYFSLSDKSLCTVDLLIPKNSAVFRTVVLLSIMYRANSYTRSSIFGFKIFTPCLAACLIICKDVDFYSYRQYAYLTKA